MLTLALTSGRQVASLAELWGQRQRRRPRWRQRSRRRSRQRDPVNVDVVVNVNVDMTLWRLSSVEQARGPERLCL
jgi:hypothetical protein